MSYLNPSELNITNAKGLDLAIQRLQIPLQSIIWLEKVFERARKNKDSKGNDFPEVWQGKGLDYYNCFPNDNLQAYSFFYAKNDENIGTLTTSFGAFSRNIDLIIFGNLNKIDSSKDYIFTEILKVDIISVLALKMNNNSVVTNYIDTIEGAFSDFSTDYIKPQFMNKKYFAMKFSITLKYTNDC